MRALIGLALVASAALPSLPAIATQPTAGQVSQRLLAEQVAINGVPGMGGAIWHKGRIIWTGSAGQRDLGRSLPVEDKTIFRLASVSKLLTATAVARLHQDGKLDVDAPIATILPYLSKDWAPLTARQVAAHVSGLPHYQDQDESRGAVHYPDARTAVGIFAARTLLQPPGKAYSYSSWGYTLLGALAEAKSGMAFPDYVARTVTTGLAIGLDATDGDNPNASRAYEFTERIARPAARHDFSYTWGGGGYGATPSALATFGGNMLRNHIVRSDTFDWMLRPAKLTDGQEVSESDYKVGFGWRTNLDEDGARTAHHNGVALGARSALLLWRDEDMAVSLLSNALWVSSIDRTARMIAAPHRQPPKGLIATPCPVQAKTYSGRFGDEAVTGSIRFAEEKGICIGTMQAAGKFKTFLDNGPQRAAEKLRVVGIDDTGGLARAGLVTPFGIFDWRANADGSFRVPFGATRELVLKLAD